LNLGVDVAIPDDYISDMGQRLRTYKRIASARDDESLRQIRAETEDRYGRVPEAVENLFAYARLRRAAEQTGVISLDRTATGLAVKLGERAHVAPDKLLALVSERPGTSFTPSGVLRVELTEAERARLIEIAHGLLLQIRAAD
jgi:transcription-repair coupling factor (superfamily II helicase)